MSMTATPSFQVLTTSETGRWRAILPASRSVFGSVEFASIVERQVGNPARLFVFNEGEEVAYPFFLRSISALPFVTDSRDAFDSLSPEYTGPLSRGEISPRVADGFRDSFADYCKSERILTEFAHLYPWSGSAQLLTGGEARLNREIVFVDVTLSESELWQTSFTRSCCKNIRKALSEGVRVFPASTRTEIEEFYRIYVGTMDRRSAASPYYFPLDYFLEFFELMPDNALFLLAEYNNRIVAATLYLHDGMDVYSYLGGADANFQHVRPTNAIIYEAILWSKRHGKQRLILGGGYQPDDGIFRFKSSFSPLRAQFCTYKRVHIPDAHTALCHSWSEYYGCEVSEDGGYFPAYRSIPARVEVV